MSEADSEKGGQLRTSCGFRVVAIMKDVDLYLALQAVVGSEVAGTVTQRFRFC